MKIKLFGLVLFAVFTINTQAQGASSDSYASQFTIESADVIHNTTPTPKPPPKCEDKTKPCNYEK